MVKWQGTADSVCRQLVWKLMTGAAIAVLAAGCTKTSKKDDPATRLAAFNYTKQAKRPPLKPNHPLHIATAYWAKKHEKNPADATSAINYARNLKALGAKTKAFDALERTYQLSPGHPVLASEYGRLALDLGKVQLAEQLLNKAHQAKGQTDWKVLSALGTVNAKRGDHGKAQSYYMAALSKQPGATSVYNNLALSYALDGKVGQAEKLLKDAMAKGHNTRKVRQNLALVLGLQSKFGEAQQVAKADLDGEKIDNNVNYLRKMVKTTQVAKAETKPAPRATRVASKSTAKARRSAKEQPARSDRITTASLPAPKEASASKTSTAPLPERKPSMSGSAPQPASQVAVAKQVSATSASKPVKKQSALLAWLKKKTTSKKKPATSASRQTASQPTNLLPSNTQTAPVEEDKAKQVAQTPRLVEKPKKSTPTWTSTVVASAALEKPASEPAPAQVKPKPFSFPMGE